MMIKIANFIPAALILITINLWLASKSSLEVIGANYELSISQILGLIGIVLMAWVLLLAGRFKMVEDWHGGLDKNYQKHHWIGSAAFVMIVNHPILLALRFIPNWTIAKNYFIPGNDFAYNLGIFSIYTLILGFIFIVFIRLPYDKWKLTHKLMGVAFLLGAWHSIIIGSDIGRFLPLKIWIFLFDIIGAFSFVYIVFLYKFIGPKYDYLVTSVTSLKDLVLIEMKPAGRKMFYQSGQFVYFQFRDKNVGNEVHPFSLTSDPDGEILSIAVKKSGDYTSKMSLIVEGTKVITWGPYGHFFNSHKPTKQIWVAGGIGITPFLSMYKHLSKSQNSQKVVLFYLVKNKEEAVFSDAFSDTEWFTLKNWYSEEGGRINAEKIAKTIGDVSEYQWFVCGPEMMMKSLENQVSKNQGFNYENFNMLR